MPLEQKYSQIGRPCSGYRNEKCWCNPIDIAGPTQVCVVYESCITSGYWKHSPDFILNCISSNCTNTIEDDSINIEECSKMESSHSGCPILTVPLPVVCLGCSFLLTVLMCVDLVVISLCFNS